MAESSRAVFLSYASQDADAARRICESLCAAGIEVWFDQSELRGGDAWDQKIRQQIRDCALFIPIISAHTATRHEGYFRLEWDLADQRTHMIARNKAFIVPVCLDATADAGADVPESFSRVQWTRLPFGETPPAFTERISRLFSLTEQAAVAPLSAAVSLALPDKPSIAVLPFTDLTGRKADDFFTDGLVDEITTALSRFSSLFVIANSSTLAYRSDVRNLQQIARELGVRYLLEGGVRQAGDQVRISVKLTDAVDNLPFWNQRFDGTKEDDFALQDKIANTIAAQIEPNIEAAELRRIGLKPASDPGPYELYLRALNAFRHYEKAGNVQVLGLLDRALELDPTFAPALSLASQTHTFNFINGWTQDSEATRRNGEELSRRAMKHGPAEARVLMSAAMAAIFLSDDLDMAAIMIERSLAINPNSSYNLMLHGWIKLLRGEAGACLIELEAATRLNPRLASSGFALHSFGFCYLALERFEEAVRMFRQAAQMRQDNEFVHFGLIVALAHLRQITEAKQQYTTLNPRVIRNYLKLFRDPRHREILHAGLSMVGAGA